MTRILVADDDHDVRAALRVALEVEGYEVEAVPNGERAMQAHEKRPADVLIADLFMLLRKPFTPGELLDKLRDCVLEHNAAGLPKYST